LICKLWLIERKMLFTTRDWHSESFPIQLANDYCMVYCSLPIFQPTPPCIVANSALWLVALYCWRDRDVTFLEI